MADNVTLPGTGAVVAADEVGGAVYQRVKLAVGADGAAADLAPGQAAMASSLPVAIASNQSAVPVSGTFYQSTQPTSDNGPAWDTVYTFTTSADATGGVDITAAPASGQKIVLTDLVVSTDTAMYVSFLEETSGTEVLRLYLAALSPVQVTLRSKLKLPVANKKLRIDASVAGNVAVTAAYYSEA